MRPRNVLFWGVVAIGIVLIGSTACTTGPLRPQYWLVWRVDNFRAEHGADEVRWTYWLVLENRGRTPAEILKGFASPSLGTVTASPDTIIDQRRTIAAGESVDVPHIVIFRSFEFNGSPISAQKAVKWQFWGKYEDGEPIILNAEVLR